jgi:four helix bundle protein
MTVIKSYRDLLVWQKAIELVVHVYGIAKTFPPDERYGLGGQLRRSAISIPSNIAEGQSRQHIGEFRQFLYVSLGSLAELDTQLIIAVRLAYLSDATYTAMDSRIVELQKMLSTLIKKLNP